MSGRPVDVFGERMLNIGTAIGKILKKKGRTLVMAESCTGGLASNRLTDVPGSSGYFIAGVVAYSNDVKKELLGVTENTIKKHGAVSREVARAMAEGARSAFRSDIAASITGIAGPGGGSRKKPVGLAFLGFTSGKISKSKRVLFAGDRRTLKESFAQALLEFILVNLKG